MFVFNFFIFDLHCFVTLNAGQTIGNGFLRLYILSLNF
jgi:hypothetical protein